MLKKIALYAMLFVLVAATTAGVVVFLNRKPKTSNIASVVTTEEEPSVLSSVVGASMSIENYKGKLNISSTDKTINLSGRFSVLDIATSPSAELSISGKLFGEDVNVRVKYKNDYIYLKYNNFGCKILAADLTDSAFINEIVEVVSMFVDTAGAGIDFDIDSILAALADIKEEETRNGYKIELSLPGIGDAVVETDKDYIPLNIEASNISLFGKNINLQISGQKDTASAVVVSSSEQNDYIDISAAKNMIVCIAKSVKNLPAKVDGELFLFGQKVDFSATVDNKFNIKLNAKYLNLNVELFYVNGSLYADVCGLKLKGTIAELIELCGTYSQIDVTKFLSELNLSGSGLTIAGIETSFEFDGGCVSNVAIDSAFASGILNFTYSEEGNVSQPNGYAAAMTFARAKTIVKSYVDLLKSNSFSLKAEGSASDINFNVSAYLKLNDRAIEDLYVGGKILNRSVYAYYKDNTAYISSEGIKVKFSNAFISDIWSYVSTLVNTDMPKIDISTVVGEQLKSLYLDANANISLELACGLEIDITNGTDEKYITVRGNAFGTDFNCNITLYSDGEALRLALDVLRPELYSDISDLSKTLTSAANTLLSENSVFKGSLTIDALDIAKLNIGVEIELDEITNDGCIKINLTNLPATCLITSTTKFKYSSQSVEIVVKGEKLAAKRFGVKSDSRTKLFERTYALKDLSADDIFDILGIGGMFGGAIRSSASSGGNGSTQNNILDMISIYRTQNGLLGDINTSNISGLKLAKFWFGTDNDEINTINALVLTDKSLVRVYLNLKKV